MFARRCLCLGQMKAIAGGGEKDAEARLLEASHFGVCRLCERLKEEGHQWLLVLTTLLVRTEDGGRFDSARWSIPSD